MKKRNTIPVVLMISSIVLLLLLQGLWLVNSYDDAHTDLRRRSTEIFRSTLLTMRDSIFMKSHESITRDSAGKIGGLVLSVDINDSPNLRVLGLPKDTVKMFAFTERTHQANVVIKQSASDTLPGKIPDRLLQRFSQASAVSDGRRITIRFAPDSLSTDTVAHYFKAALSKNRIDLPFTIKSNIASPFVFSREQRNPQMELELRRRASGFPIEEPVTPEGAMATEWVRFSPVVHYASVFDGVKPYLFKQISLQIIFSCALTLLTTAAFLMMYRSMRSQQKLMELKNDFISNITHELKTPVTTVSVALEALKNFKGLENPQTTKEYLEIAQLELNRLTLLTDKVLKTAAFENGKVSFDMEPVDMHKTVEQILHSMKLIFEKQKAKVSFEQTGSSFVIRGGSVHLTNVVYNLLDNALKYSGADPQISVRLEENDHRVILKVADRGIGIPSEYRKKIFEKFFRVPHGDVHNVKGYGLGLSYVESVIRSHQGMIEVVSNPGEGSEFIVSLPKGS